MYSYMYRFIYMFVCINRYASSTPSDLRLCDAGWHLSFFSDAEGVMHKMQACVCCFYI